MIELLLILLKKMETYLGIFFKIICYLTALFTLHFTSVLIEMLFTMYMCCFIHFYKDCTSKYLVLMVFRLS